MTCKTCKYFDPRTCVCRVNPPELSRSATYDDQQRGVWPYVWETDWCGNHDNGMPL